MRLRTIFNAAVIAGVGIGAATVLPALFSFDPTAIGIVPMIMGETPLFPLILLPSVLSAAMTGMALHSLFNQKSQTQKTLAGIAAVAGAAGIVATLYSMEMIVPLKPEMGGWQQILQGLGATNICAGVASALTFFARRPDAGPA